MSGRPTLRPGDSAARASSGSMSIGQPSAAQPVGDLAETTEPIGPLTGEKGGHAAVLRIDEIRQQVHVAGCSTAVISMPVTRRRPSPARGAACLGDAGERVVIGDADRREPGARGARDQRGGRQGAVGGRGVKVKIDQDAAADCAPRLALAAAWRAAFAAGARRARGIRE